MTSQPDPFPRTSRFILGYEVDEVDDFVARVMQTLAGKMGDQQPVTAAEARSVRFRRAFGGYNPDAVDQALDEWAANLPE